jgi:hypothetical protein
MVGLSRFNAVIMIVGYLLYLLFQLGSHKDEFEDFQDEGEEVADENFTDGEEGQNQGQGHNAIKTKKKVRTNKFCRHLFKGCKLDDAGTSYRSLAAETSTREMEMSPRAPGNNILSIGQSSPAHVGNQPGVLGEKDDIPQCREASDGEESRNGGEVMNGEAHVTFHVSNVSGRRRTGQLTKRGEDVPQLIDTNGMTLPEISSIRQSNKSHCSDGDEEEAEPYVMSMNMATIGENGEESKSFHC